MTVFFIFIFGLLIGSFLNAVVYRLEVGGSIVTQRSRCPRCLHVLSWCELIPVVSFAVQRRKCRACKQPISWQYPVVELAAGTLFSWLFFLFPDAHPAYFLYLFFTASGLLVIFIFDLKHYIIPNRVLYPLTAAALAYALFMGFFLEPWLTLVALFIAYFVGALVSSVVLLLKRRGLQSEIPFGPFLVLGTLASFAYGSELINWYLHINILLL